MSIKFVKKIVLSIIGLMTVLFFAVGCIQGSDSSDSSFANPSTSSESTDGSGSFGDSSSDENGGKWTEDVELPSISGK